MFVFYQDYEDMGPTCHISQIHFWIKKQIYSIPPEIPKSIKELQLILCSSSHSNCRCRYTWICQIVVRYLGFSLSLWITELLATKIGCLFIALVQSFLGDRYIRALHWGWHYPWGLESGVFLVHPWIQGSIQPGIGWLWTVPQPILIQSPDSDVHTDSSHCGRLSKHFNYQIHDRSYIDNDWMNHRKPS